MRTMKAGGVALALLLVASAALAERLPVNVYDTGDGLAADTVHDLLVDRQGFLWVATLAGLSRFDGAEMVSYGVADGVPGPVLHALLQPRDGTLLVGGAGGL